MLVHRKNMIRVTVGWTNQFIMNNPNIQMSEGDFLCTEWTQQNWSRKAGGDPNKELHLEQGSLFLFSMVLWGPGWSAQTPLLSPGEGVSHHCCKAGCFVHVDMQGSDIPSSSSLVDTAGVCFLTLRQGNAPLFLSGPLWFLQTRMPSGSCWLAMWVEPFLFTSYISWVWGGSRLLPHRKLPPETASGA